MSDLIVSTNLEDYAPGSTATITASGFAAGTTLKFEVDHANGDESGAGHEPWYVVDGGAGDLDGVANGVIQTSWYVNPDDSLSGSFMLTATAAGADGSFGTADDVVATDTFSDAVITATDIKVTHDETALLQNYLSTAPGDADDNDTSASLPTAFATRLNTLLAGTTGVTETLIGAALSGFNAANPNGQNAFTVTPAPGATITDVGFTNAAGAPLNGFLVPTFTTADGDNIYLYTDTTDNNILVGRAGGATGAIVFAAYIEQSMNGSAITGGKIWLVQYEALDHPNITNPDDPLDLTNLVHIGTSQDLQFSLAGAPSGQNLFLMFTTATPTTFVDDGVTRIADVAIIATGKDPANQSAQILTVRLTISTSRPATPSTPARPAGPPPSAATTRCWSKARASASRSSPARARA